MDLSRLSTTDLSGRYYLKDPGGGGRFAGYYASLDALRPLLASAEWQAAVTGYYLNVAGDFDAVRLTYLTPHPLCVRHFPLAGDGRPSALPAALRAHV